MYIQDSNNADKTSVSSERSFKLCSDDTDSTVTTSSYSKRNRLSQLMPQQNRSAGAGGSTVNQPETDQLIVGETIKDASIEESSPNNQPSPPPNKLSLNFNQANTQTNDSTSQTSTSADTSNTQLKNMSKTALRRHLFFSQISSNANVNANVTEQLNLTNSKDTN